MTPQEIYDKAALHLYTQNERSGRNDGSGYCMYRGPNGLKCAVGALLDDSLYDPDMEGKDVGALRVEYDVPDWFEDNQVLLNSLQSCHDVYEPEDWEDQLGVIAVYHGLKPMPRPTA